MEFRQNARRFLYCQLFRSSLGFENYLEEGYRKGYVHLKKFTWNELLPENSTTIQVLMDGINDLDPGLNPRLRTSKTDENNSPFQSEKNT
ncbi:MAG: hypothetical protein HGA23_06120 [Bacteroidales bacterium]|nr:hypothetical protein [Bacteroidales bacterium]